MKLKWPLLLLVVTATSVVAYALGDVNTKEIGGQRFSIPNDRIFNAQIFWLPRSNSPAFTFILDPADDPRMIPPHRVLVQNRADVCGPKQAQMIRIACERENANLQTAWKYEKVFPIPDYPYAWDYYKVGASPDSSGGHQRIQVAYCSPISPNPHRPKGTAICTTVWSVGNLILSLGFEENELADLNDMKKRATALLNSWKVR